MTISRRAITLLFFSLFITWVLSSLADNVDEDLDDLQVLLSIDEEEEQGGAAHGKLSEAELLSRAQRIVVELKNDNAQQVIDGNELVMVLGYAPWCQRSAELMPRYAEAAMALKEMGSPVMMAKLDAERHTKAAGQLGIKGFPTLIFFVNGTAMAYTGGFTGEEILIWVRKKSGFPLVRLSSVTAAEEFLKKYQIHVIGLFENFKGIEYEEFVKAASTENEIQFVETNDIEVAKVLYPHVNINTSFIGIVKREPEKFVRFEESIVEENILNFVRTNKFPLITALTELNSARVYSSPLNLQVYFLANADDFKLYNSVVEDIARRFNTKIMFIHVDSAEENLAKPFFALFGLETESPVVIAFNNRIGLKYLMESDITRDNLEEFASGLLRGDLSPFFKSEPIPNKKLQDGLVEKIVSKTFDSSILDSMENVFLEVHTPWCIDCEATSKRVEKLAKHFKGQENLKFARIDASLNEHPKLQIDNYPVLLFYPAGNKSEPIKLSKKSTIKELATFVKEKLASETANISRQEVPKKDEL
ncbi:hypothetical protein HPP92_021304 [Vanilla planifolia]|uniref:protein disulfide-isomerase n=1 Tax=Vanilla planifolia TaxID=51239 RepID=A0A835Q5B9_VANPL|nr:hypothetical protein HPP92_021304 [Vanilla planifolia]